jgi:predicted ATPase
MLADLLKNFRVFEVDAKKARRPAEFDRENSKLLDSDAGNLASFLRWLHDYESDVFQLFVEDLRTIAPTVEDVRIVKIGGVSEEAVAVQLKERGLSGLTNMSEASFGTIRAMALLAMLHDPNPPRLTCVEEIDHGLHPHALDRIVERLRSASRRTQLLVVTHSPALANRLNPGELIVCERDLETGASRIPAISAVNITKMAAASRLNLGELWFSGALGGGLE